MYGEVVRACKELLYHDIAADGREYIKSRILDYSINRFDIGYFPNDDNLHHLEDLVGFDLLKNLNLAYEFNVVDRRGIRPIRSGFFSDHNIIFPLKDEYGNIVSLSGRILPDDHKDKDRIPKYKNTIYEKSLYLYGLYYAKNAIHVNDGVFIVEGQIDCINCHSNGIYNVVSLNCGNFSRYQFGVLKRITNNIYLLLDNDESGKKAEKKIVRKFGNRCNIRKISLPQEFGDVDEYVKNSNSLDIFHV
jgi:DNA primase